jgi:hypothetical protein
VELAKELGLTIGAIDVRTDGVTVMPLLNRLKMPMTAGSVKMMRGKRQRHAWRKEVWEALD